MPLSPAFGVGGVPMRIVCGLPEGAAELSGDNAASCASVYACASSMTTRSNVPPRPMSELDPRVLNSICPPFLRSKTICPALIV